MVGDHQLRIWSGERGEIFAFDGKSVVAIGASALLLAVLASRGVFPYAIRICFVHVSIAHQSWLEPLTDPHESLAPQYTPACRFFACSRP